MRDGIENIVETNTDIECAPEKEKTESELIKILKEHDLLSKYQEFKNDNPVLEETIKNYISRLEEENITDALTGVHNRRHYEHTLRSEVKRAERYSRKVSLVIVDLDEFHGLNETYGHPAGDIVLKKIAKILKQGTRISVDYVFRIGGDEFAIILPETNEEDTEVALKRIQKTISTLHEELGMNDKITISIGVASYNNGYLVNDAEHFKVLSDQAQYVSKNNKNTLTCYKTIYAALT